MKRNANSASKRIASIFANLQYIDSVETSKTVYYVFQNLDDFVLYSFRDAGYKAGYFSVVASETIDRIHKTFSGRQRVTRKEIEVHPKMKKFLNNFDVLHSLYVLIALRKASIDKRSKQARTLYFNIYKP